VSDFNVTVSQTKGFRNDKGRQFIPEDYLYEVKNFDLDDGLKRIKCPSISYNVGNDKINGLYNFRYIDSSGAFQSELIMVQGANVIKNPLTSPTTIHTGLTLNKKCTFAILNDKLFISNGTDYPLVYDGDVVYEMGSPKAKTLTSGSLSGNYQYALSYVVSGVELVIGTVSNTVTASSNNIKLTLPIGPNNCTSRKIYRTDSGGTQLKLLATINDNTTMEHTDNTADSSLGANIPATNSSCPKPQYITVKNERLIGCGDNERPNILYLSEIEIEIFFKTFGAYDVSNVGNDNTKLTGLAIDYNQVVVFSERNIYLVDVSGTLASVKQTNSNVGCINGFSIGLIPADSGMNGGIIFVSNLYDVRIFSGNSATNLANQLDNLTTDNFSSMIKKELFSKLLKDSNENNTIHAEFLDYKYHLITDSDIYVFNTKILGWTKYNFSTTSYSPTYWTISKIENDLYLGQKTAGILEKMYQDVTYRSEPLKAEFETPEIMVDGTDRVFFRKLHFYFDNTGVNQFDVLVTTDSKKTNRGVVSYEGGFYDSNFYDSEFYFTGDEEDDYKVMHINEYGQWLRIKITTEQLINFKGWRLTGNLISNKEL